MVSDVESGLRRAVSNCIGSCLHWAAAQLSGTTAADEVTRWRACGLPVWNHWQPNDSACSRGGSARFMLRRVIAPAPSSHLAICLA